MLTILITAFFELYDILPSPEALRFYVCVIQWTKVVDGHPVCVKKYPDKKQSILATWCLDSTCEDITTKHNSTLCTKMWILKIFSVVFDSPRITKFWNWHWHYHEPTPHTNGSEVVGTPPTRGFEGWGHTFRCDARVVKTHPPRRRPGGEITPLAFFCL